MKRVLGVVAVVGAVAVASASPAAAADDSFVAATTDNCGAVDFVDYGPGAPGGGNNDDYVVIHDYCADGHGVMAWVWHPNGWYAGSNYNGNGLAGKPVIWDPFFNVKADEEIRMVVCLVDGPEDETGSRCGDESRVSVDG